MLKFVIISILVIYLIVRVTGFLLKVMFGPLYQQKQAAANQPQDIRRRKAPNSNLNIDQQPNENGKRQFKGGDYVDYEEVK